ncbi:MAG: sigma 54-interacting transcriptional regulator, partial [Myxococcota bacterium]
TAVPAENEFCRLVLFSEDGFRECNGSVKEVHELLRGGRRSARSRSAPPALVVHPCHLGFVNVAAPIRIGDELLGFLFAGGALTRSLEADERSLLVDRARELSSAEALAADGDAAELIERVPQLSEGELRRLGELLQYGAAEVATCHRERMARRPAPTQERDVGARFTEIVGDAPAMREVYELLDKIVRSESTVLIHGESGTGKELIARAIHYHGPRAKKPFVVQNCSALNDNLLESALFGHMRGSFTGAVKDQKGLFEVADGGTFFLDEIGDMSPALQVKLLRVLQESTFTPVGASKPVKVDVRIIAASHKDLAAMVERGQFREDLFYRVNVLKIEVPPLRRRLEDMPSLLDYFLRKHHSGDGEPPQLAGATFAAMLKYRWPGNIRELENEVERLMVLSVGQPE